MEENKEIIEELQNLLKSHLKVSELNGYINITNDGINELRKLYPLEPEKPKKKKTSVNISKLREKADYIVKQSEEYNKLLDVVKKGQEEKQLFYNRLVHTLVGFIVADFILFILMLSTKHFLVCLIVFAALLAVCTLTSFILRAVVAYVGNRLPDKKELKVEGADYEKLFDKVYTDLSNEEEKELKKSDEKSYKESVATYKIEMKKYTQKVEALKINENLLTQKLNQYNESKAVALNNLNSLIEHCKYIPEDYAKSSIAVATLISYFKNKRADSLKEAINLYEMEKHLGKIVESLDANNNILSEGFKGTYLGMTMLAKEIAQSLYSYQDQISYAINQASRDSMDALNLLTNDISGQIASHNKDVNNELKVIEMEVLSKK